jgi:Ca-activated chloride channel family protein
VTFLSPGWLVLLLAPVALLAAYVLAQRARRRYTVRFTSVDLLASVAPRRPGWQRHIPAIALLGAITLLVLGVAHPSRAERVARQRATVVVAIDTSGSMASTDVSPTRLIAAQRAARRFVSGLPSGIQVGLLSFDSTARMLVTPTADRTSVRAGIDQLQVGGATATGDAINLALNAISALPPTADGKKTPALIVLMSDGSPNVGNAGQTPAQAVSAADAAAKQANVPIDTIAFGTPDGVVNVQGQMIGVPADPAAMAQIAEETGGRSFTATSASQLTAVYDQIGRAVGYDTHQHDITVWFTAAGLVVLILAAGAALVWTQRLV